MSHWTVKMLGVWALFAATCYADDAAALIELESSGATIKREGSQPTGKIVSVSCNLLQITPEANRALADIEYLPAVEFLGAGNTEVSVATLKALQDKTMLKRLSISFAKISDDAAKILGALKSLEALDLLAQNEISLMGLAQIFNLTNLMELSLSDRLVTDEIVEELPRFSNLRRLSLRSVFITDAGVKSLKRLKNLRTLQIFIGAKVSADGLKELAKLNVQELDLTFSDVTNEKLKGLRTFSGLKALRLVNAIKVTDEAVPSIVELTDLKELDLADATLTKSGIQQLKKALPKCSIVYENRKRD